MPDALRVDRATPAQHGPASLYIHANARHQAGLATQPAFPGAADVSSTKDNSTPTGFFSATREAPYVTSP